ncbi:hypothetical protein Achl_4100 (plasmid) [Pseudarthrobacter chlorophenolicus A6]|uniref:Uncharacterized protein n=1 Tax=Pseudarthrobacter chlorophenolicus (strain ATCC 700700 / DSM 12829 / CIP 107037 / JCM 12360 / KCTC 9906 / NCIMB 13794 / A6) TaxID=452863 RepID=B8HI04_PSECP|nr:hypothetical protein [Pseudarthrobacter chlorophenolicus]ACL42051.1 hypothetical protein Achl_4100 [Pseudarthrobacter chlorophenolicus A6]SDQ20872.1 hypothetical protein SAMN04489738_0750 [Pseudarthrobacter chlorophenolicus]
MSTQLPPAPDLRSGINAVTFFAFAMFGIRLWYGLDPQPDPIADAIERASYENMEAYVVALCVALFGLWVILRYMIGAIINGLASQAGASVSWLCILTAALLVGAVLTPYTAGLAGAAVIAAFVTNWAVEAIRLRRAAG